ncbi:hypothetical protein NFI96_022433 [Prochilodus magdalenae]|nr:hypothetical protein NFI96_022433 [Prochilodus magdalenae]
MVTQRSDPPAASSHRGESDTARYGTAGGALTALLFDTTAQRKKQRHRERMGARAGRLLRRFNLESRAHKEIGKDKPEPAPRHETYKPVERGQWSEDSGARTVERGQWGEDSGARTVERGQWGEDSGARTVGRGQWSEDSGARTVGRGQWGEDSGARTVGRGQWGEDSGARTVGRGQWGEDSGARTVERGQWGEDSGARTVERGQWGEDSGARTVERGQWGEDSGARTVERGQWSEDSGARTVGRGQWGEDSGARTVGRGQWSEDSGARTVGRGQWGEDSPVVTEEVHSKDDPLLFRLKQVYVESKDPVKQTAVIRDLKKVERRPLKCSFPGDHLGIGLISDIPVGKISIVEALKALNDHKRSPQTWTLEKIAQEYSVQMKDAAALVEFFIPFEVKIIPPKSDGRKQIKGSHA